MRSRDSALSRASRDSISLQASRPHDDRSRVHAGAIPDAVRPICDSAEAITVQALALAIHREEGNFLDTSRETPRAGCRLTVTGSFKTLRNEAGPVAALQESFARHRWRQDLRHGADGPDGSAIGMRFRDKLCLVAGRWNGADDSDTSSNRANQDQSYQGTIECAHDVATNKDAGVPDSIWSIASRAGLDSIYAISLSLQYPPYLEGDFDGDGVNDAAVLIEQRSTGKIGVAIVRRGMRQVTVLGAGRSGAGPDDIAWLDAWDVFRKGATLHLTIHDRPREQLIADALWVGRRDFMSAFYVWTPGGFVYEAHALKPVSVVLPPPKS